MANDKKVNILFLGGYISLCPVYKFKDKDTNEDIVTQACIKIADGNSTEYKIGPNAIHAIISAYGNNKEFKAFVDSLPTQKA